VSLCGWGWLPNCCERIASGLLLPDLELDYTREPTAQHPDEQPSGLVPTWQAMSRVLHCTLDTLNGGVRHPDSTVKCMQAGCVSRMLRFNGAMQERDDTLILSRDMPGRSARAAARRSAARWGPP